MNREFMREVEASGYIHRPLPLHPERSLEAELANKQVLKRKSIWHNGTECDFIHSGVGNMYLAQGEGHDGKNAIAMTAPLRADTFPDGTTTNGQYANFGTLKISHKIDRENWQAYNRFTFHVRPDYQGGENVHIIAAISNDGEVKIPDIYHREGYHVVNLENHRDNHIIWEIQDLARDCVTEISFYMFLSGNNGLTAENVLYYIDDIALETVAQPDHAKGWKADYPLISYPTSGYMTHGRKTAVSTITAADTFSIQSAASGNVVLEGKIEKIRHPHGEELGLIDFSALTQEGEYRICVGNYQTPAFPIAKSVIEEATWKIINYLFCQRCGYPVPGIHEGCHHDMIAEHDGKQIAFIGGWHDAGDLTQSVLQTAEIAMALCEAAVNTDPNSQLYLRLLEEAEWGLDLVIRSRFGDGYRIEGEGCIRYTDGIIGNFDDIKVNVDRRALNNFIYAAVEAYAGTVFQPLYEGRALNFIKAAKEDFAFAMEDYEKDGCYVGSSGHERTTGESLFYALASEAASRIYEATGIPYYAKTAEEFADKMLKFQETGKAQIPVVGFFYRDMEHKYPQHFNHQSREQGFMRALVLLCNTQKQNPKRPVWENAMKLYGQYLKDMMAYAAPYGLIPSGVYSLDEVENSELFATMHPGSRYETERDNIEAQIKNGIPLNDRFYIRVFPVWTSFRGNAAVQCASGKAATMLGRYFDDEELLQIGLEQLYWISGKNPFNQSIIYGEGRRYCQQYAISTGEVTGEIPVGMESFSNEDIPYWPQGNNCTYKEVWTSPAGRWLWVAADLIS